MPVQQVRIRNIRMSSLPSKHVTAFAGRNEVSGDERLLRVAIGGYVSRLCEKAMVRVRRKAAMLCARRVVHNVGLVAIRWHQAAYDDVLERLAIMTRKRKGLHQLHLLTKELVDAKRQRVQRRARTFLTKTLRHDCIRLGRMALHPKRFAVRRVSGEEVHIPADGLDRVADIYSRVRAWLDLPQSVTLSLVDVEDSGRFPVDDRGVLISGEGKPIGGCIAGNLFGLVLSPVLSRLWVWVCLPDGNYTHVECRVDPHPLACELTPPQVPMHDVYVSVRRELDLEKRLSLVLYAASLDGMKSGIILSPSRRDKAASLNSDTIYAEWHP